MGKKKSKVICHMISTIDGRLIVDRYSEPYDRDKTVEDYVKEYYDIGEQQFGTNVILNGRTTVVKHYMPNLFDYKKHRPTTNFETYKAIESRKEWTQVVLDPQGKTLYENIPESDDVITILSEQVSDEYLTHLEEEGVSYLFAGKDGKDYNKALEILYTDFGIEKLLLEGGGITNGVFLKEGLIDELSLSIYPGIDGLAGMPTIFEFLGKGEEYPANGQSLELKTSKILSSGLVWLHYTFHKK